LIECEKENCRSYEQMYFYVLSYTMNNSLNVLFGVAFLDNNNNDALERYLTVH
jgi:hypothetical protein